MFGKGVAGSVIWKLPITPLDGDSLDNTRKYVTSKTIIWCWLNFAQKTSELLEIGVSFAVAPEAVSADRSFRGQRLIHTEERNRLSLTKVDKLLFSYCNMRLLYNLPELSMGELALGEFVVAFLNAEESLEEPVPVSWNNCQRQGP